MLVNTDSTSQFITEYPQHQLHLNIANITTKTSIILFAIDDNCRLTYFENSVSDDQGLDKKKVFASEICHKNHPLNPIHPYFAVALSGENVTTHIELNHSVFSVSLSPIVKNEEIIGVSGYKL